MSDFQKAFGQLIGAEGGGFSYIQKDFAKIRATYGSRCVGVAQGAKTEAETAFKSWIDRWMADRDFVTREEFDAARAMAQKAREENAALEARIAALRLYEEAAAFAKGRGIIIADTKFEFGIDAAGTLHLIDEALTPDSSRFWPADQYQVGISPPSYDKQFVRDYLETLDWDKTPPAPKLPAEVIEKTAGKYQEALTRLTGAQ